MKTTNLAQLFTPRQCKKIVGILEDAKTDTERVKELKQYYNNFKKELTDKGVLPDYLAWVTLHNWKTLQEEKETGDATENN